MSRVLKVGRVLGQAPAAVACLTFKSKHRSLCTCLLVYRDDAAGAEAAGAGPIRQAARPRLALAGGVAGPHQSAQTSLQI